MDIKLPERLVTKQDVVHVHRELQVFRDSVTQSIMRHDKPIKYPSISANLRSLVFDNQLNLHDDKVCQQLQADLDNLKEKMIVLNISFTTEPPVAVVHKIIVWLRQEIDPKIVLQIGLQPSLAAGIILRTNNHQYDFSLRQHLYEKRDLLIGALRANGQ